MYWPVVRAGTPTWAAQVLMSLGIVALSHHSTLPTVKRAVEIESGVSIVPSNTVRQESESGLLVAIEFEGAKMSRPLGVLTKRFAVELEGLDEIAPKHPTLGDVDSPEARERYQEAKRAYKARMKSQAG